MQKSDVLEIVKHINKRHIDRVFDIRVSSRHDDLNEIEDMVKFCTLLNHIGLVSNIDNLFYDSNSSLCIIKTYVPVEQPSFEYDAIYACASMSLRQFEFCGRIGHKNPFLTNFHDLNLDW